MPLTIAKSLNPRRALLGVFALMLVLSLVCSTSVRYGHADVPIAATADEIQPLRVGDAAPRFTVETVEGEAFDFDPRALDRPAILVVFRGGWCPYCNTQLSELRHVVPEIDAMGFDVLFLSGDRAELLYDSLDEETLADIDGLGYRILSDAKANAAIALGIAFRASDRTIRRRHEKGQDIEASSMVLHGVLPVPAVFAIDATGQIRFAYANADYKLRLPADELRDVAGAMAGN
jgi:peroxiredoxin